MNFLNLGLGELLGLVGAISAGVVALYLLDRSKRHQLVSTLRFWSAADVRTELKHRRRIQQPWSLLLQLISLALLLTAIAGPQLGIFDVAGRDHVIVLDTSAWMGSRLNTTAGRGILMDQAKADARAYLRSIPRRDRVMLVRADALATPATAFESSRSVLESAIQQSQPGASALNLAQALEFADRAQKLQSQRAGEIVFVGAGRVSEEEAALSALPANLRVVTTSSTLENVGLRKIGLRRSPSAPDQLGYFRGGSQLWRASGECGSGLAILEIARGIAAVDAPSGHRGTGYVHLRRQIRRISRSAAECPRRLPAG